MTREQGTGNREQFGYPQFSKSDQEKGNSLLSAFIRVHPRLIFDISSCTSFNPGYPDSDISLIIFIVSTLTVQTLINKSITCCL